MMVHAEDSLMYFFYILLLVSPNSPQLVFLIQAQIQITIATALLKTKYK